LCCSCSCAGQNVSIEGSIRSQSDGDSAASREAQINDAVRHLSCCRFRPHHRLYRRSVDLCRPTRRYLTPAAVRHVTGNDVIEVGAGSGVVGVSRGRKRDDVLPVRVQLYGAAVLGGGRIYHQRQPISVIFSSSIGDLLSQRLQPLRRRQQILFSQQVFIPLQSIAASDDPLQSLGVQAPSAEEY